MAKTKSQKSGGQVSVSINLDTTPVLYTDNIHITTNPNGVTLDVIQRVGPTSQARIVSRVGMSREHAKTFAQELSRLLALTEGQGKAVKVKS